MRIKAVTGPIRIAWSLMFIVLFIITVIAFYVSLYMNDIYYSSIFFRASAGLLVWTVVGIGLSWALDHFDEVHKNDDYEY
jgi:hypothetical protein